MPMTTMQVKGFSDYNQTMEGIQPQIEKFLVQMTNYL